MSEFEYGRGGEGSTARTHEAKEQARHLGQEAKERVRGVATEAREQVRAAAEERKGVVAGELGELAGALRDTASTLEQRDHGMLARSARATADTIEEIAERLRRGDIDAVMQQTERFARDYPVAFLGGAIGLGFVAGRVLRSGYGGARHGGEPRGYGERARPSFGGEQAASFGGGSTRGPTSSEPGILGGAGSARESFGAGRYSHSSSTPIGSSGSRSDVSSPSKGPGSAPMGPSYGASAPIPSEAKAFDEESRSKLPDTGPGSGILGEAPLSSQRPGPSTPGREVQPKLTEEGRREDRSGPDRGQAREGGR